MPVFVINDNGALAFYYADIIGYEPIGLFRYALVEFLTVFVVLRRPRLGLLLSRLSP